MDINIKIEGFDELQRNFAGAKDKFYVLMKSAITKSVTKIQAEAKDNAQTSRDTGKLVGNIRRGVRGLTGEVIAGAKHSVFVEEGTRPHMPPIAPLEAWAGRKLGDSGLGYVIARKIAREGTKPQPFMRPAVDDSIRDVERYFESAVDDFIKVLAQ